VSEELLFSTAATGEETPYTKEKEIADKFNAKILSLFGQK